MEIVSVLLSESVEITLNKSVNEICEHCFYDIKHMRSVWLRGPFINGPSFYEPPYTRSILHYSLRVDREVPSKLEFYSIIYEKATLTLCFL